MAEGDPSGVLITGVYGVGKSTLAAEMAETLERRAVPYGAIDLDWLRWFDVPGTTQPGLDGVHLANVADVVGNYLSVGVQRFVLAGAVRTRDEIDALQRAAGIPLRVVRLEVPLDEIEARLRGDPTAGRRDDLVVAAQWIEGSVGVGIEDLTVANHGPVDAVADRILRWLGWTS